MVIHKIGVATAVACLALPLHAQIAFDSFMQGEQFSNTGWNLHGTGTTSPSSWAFGFSSLATGRVTEILVAASKLETGVGTSVRLELFQDNGTQQGVGALIGSWDFQTTETPGLVTILNNGSATVVQGQWYWMHMKAVDPSGRHVWYWGDGTTLAPALISSNGGQTFEFTPEAEISAFRVTVPEPSGAIVCILGITLFATRRRK